jgi:putative FmdB family regulatory protein
MPIYEYECSACKNRFERSQRFSDPALTECPECGGPVRRVLFPAGIVFKGSGWYATDSRKPAPSETASTAAGSADKSDKSASSAGETEAKTETKSESTAKKTESSAAAGAGA